MLMDFRKPKLLFPSIFLLLALYYTLPFLMKLRYWGVRDWDLFSSIAAIPVGSVLHYGQFPFWNMYMGGGNILFHHPEVAVLTPFFLLYLAFGAIVGLKLQVFVCYFLGFWGSYRMGRSLGLSSLAAVMLSVAYFGSVHFALHFAEGHMPFTHFAFLPWFLRYVLESRSDGGSWVKAAVVLALMLLGNGAAIPFLYTALLSALLLGLRGVQQRSFSELRSLLAATATGLLLASIKIVPMLTYLLENEWAGNPGESIPIRALGVIFFGLEHSLFAQNFSGQFWGWHEYGAYVSPVLMVLALIAVIVRFKDAVTWMVVGVFFLILGLGDFGSLSPWALLSDLPGFASARCTGRAFQFVILSSAVLAGLGLDYLRSRWRERRDGFGRTALLGLLRAGVAVVIATNLVLAWPIMASGFTQPPKVVPRADQFRHVVDPEPQAYENYLANRGSLITPWLSAYHPSRGLVGPGDVVYPEYIQTGSAEIVRRDYTPNVITYHLRGNTPGEIVIGMGFDRGWSADDGRPLRSVQGLIAFDFTAGEQVVVLRYRPPLFLVGALGSLLGLGLTGFFWWRYRRARLFRAGGTHRS